jgi:hypothetical protein
MEKQYIKNADGTYYRINEAGEKQQIKSGCVNFWSGKNSLLNLTAAEQLALPAGLNIPYYPQEDSERHYKALVSKYPQLATV